MAICWTPRIRNGRTRGRSPLVVDAENATALRYMHLQEAPSLEGNVPKNKDRLAKDIMLASLRITVTRVLLLHDRNE
jgi:hypothetical protein